MRRLFLAGLVGGLSFALTATFPTSALPPPQVVGAKDVQELVFFGDARPVLIRLHVRIDGRPFEDLWLAHIRRLFDYLDHDGNGILTKSEAEHAPSGQQLLQQMQGNLFGQTPNPTASFGDLDVDPIDGIVTLQKLARYYRKTAGPLQVLTSLGTARSDALTRELFKHLDTNKDGKLSKGELLAAATVLASLDFDDDEMISAQEIVAALPGPAFTANTQAGVARPAPWRRRVLRCRSAVTTRGHWPTSLSLSTATGRRAR